MPGDERGYVSNTRLPEHGFEPKQNLPGTAYTAGDAYTQGLASRLQKAPTASRSRSQARCVAGALVDAASRRGWRILRAAVMANHVHVVLINCPDDGPLVRRVLKGCSQAALCKFEGEQRRWWTAAAAIGRDR